MLKGLYTSSGTFSRKKAKWLSGGSGPTENFDFTTGIIPSNLTFTRATTGTYYNSSGVLTTAAINAPRFDYDPNSLQLRGLLLEASVTNLQIYSGNSGQGWAGGVINYLSLVTAPDGVQQYIQATATATNTLTKGDALTLVNSTRYTASIYYKASTNSQRYFELQISDFTSQAFTAVFDTTTGIATVASGASNTINYGVGSQYLGNGVWRFYAEGASTAWGTTPVLAVQSSTVSTGGSTTVGTNFLIWGAQVEATGAQSGSSLTTQVPSSYISTDSGTTTTRAADILETNTLSWFANNGTGTFIINGQTPYAADGTANEMIGGLGNSGCNLYFGPNGAVNYYGNPGNTGLSAPAISFGSYAQYAVGIAYNASGISISMNGSVPGTSTNVVASSTTALYFGSAGGTSYNLRGWLSSISYYNTALSSSQLELATTQKPIYALDFTTGVLDPSLTFTRSSTANYYNSSGILTQATTNAPRFDYNPATLALNGLLVEQQSTNLGLSSNGFGADNVTVIPNAVLSPDGTLNANLATASAGLQFHYATSFSSSPGVAVGNLTGTYTYSVYAQAGTISTIYLGFGPVNTSQGTFNLSTGVVSGLSSGYTGAMQNVGNGWWRCSLTATFSSAAATYATVWLLQGNATALGTESANLYGSQYELTSFPTSYIPTTTSTVTRSADVLANSSVVGFYNNLQGSLIAECITAPVILAYQGLACFSDGTNNNRIEIVAGTGTNQGLLYTQAGTTGQVSFTTGPLTDTKIGISYSTTSNLGAVNSTAITPGAWGSQANPLTINLLQLGYDRGTGGYLNGWLRKFTYYNVALTAAQLATVTT